MEYVNSAITLKDFILKDSDNSKITEVIASLDRQLKYLHSKGYYVESMGFNDVVVNDYQDFGFTRISRMDKNQNNESTIKGNIKSLVLLSLGSYALSNSVNDGYVSNTEWFDYNEIDKRDPSFVSNNYDFIRTTIPYGTDYYDDVINNGNIYYFSDYIAQKSRESNGKGNSRSLVYATAAGRALSEKNKESAFVKISFYPIIIGCFLMIGFVIYTLLLHT